MTGPKPKPKPRPQHTEYKPLGRCPENLAEVCEKLDLWGRAWTKWGNSVLEELDYLEMAVCQLEQNEYYGGTHKDGVICNKGGRIVRGPGDPPGNSTQPPPPPFKP